MSEEVTHENEVIADANGKDTLVEGLKRARAQLTPIGKTIVLEVPGYEGKLGIEYNYINSEVTEAIAKKVSKELRPVHGQGETLLGSIDTLDKACKQVLIRDNHNDKWRPIGGTGIEVKFTPKLAEILDYVAREPREVVLGLFGSEHAIIRQNVMLSRWLTEVTRKVDEDFFD